MKARIPRNVNGGGAQNMNQMIKQAQKMQDIRYILTVSA